MLKPVPRFFVIVFFLFGSILGCSQSDRPELVEVAGTLTKGGKPFSGASVEFYPEGPGGASYGITDVEGKFKLNYSTGLPGAAVGRHSVKVIGGQVAGVVTLPMAATPMPGSDDLTLAMAVDPNKEAARPNAANVPIVLSAEVLPDVINTLSLTIP